MEKNERKTEDTWHTVSFKRQLNSAFYTHFTQREGGEGWNLIAGTGFLPWGWVCRSWNHTCGSRKWRRHRQNWQGAGATAARHCLPLHGVLTSQWTCSDLRGKSRWHRKRLEGGIKKDLKVSIYSPKACSFHFFDIPDDFINQFQELKKWFYFHFWQESLEFRERGKYSLNMTNNTRQNGIWLDRKLDKTKQNKTKQTTFIFIASMPVISKLCHRHWIWYETFMEVYHSARFQKSH